MQLVIHRGAHEIGGNCIEVAQNGARIILDLGMPLVEPHDKKKKFDSFSVAKKSIAELTSEGILPPVHGLYRGTKSEKPIDAILISHPHQDHYGLIDFARKDIPVYLAEETRRIIEVSDIFLPHKANIAKPIAFRNSQPFKVGPFKVTPYLMDHSAFGAYAFFIEAGGKRIFYSGDFRGHGRKAGLFRKFLRTAPRPVDCLLLEGTTLNRPEGITRTEMDLEEEIVAVAKKYPKIKLVYTSVQNIDRMVSFYRAAIRTKALFVVDLYAAYLLDQVSEFAKIPHPAPSFKNLRVFFSKRMMRHLFRQDRKDIVYKYRPFEISAAELRERTEGTFMIFRDSLLEDCEKIGEFNGSALIYGMFKGYMREPRFEMVQRFLKEKGMPLEILHTSGHASTKDLQAFAEALSPKMLIPIHTLHAEKYQELFRHVSMLNDGEVLTV